MGLWMAQVARNLSDAAEGFLIGKRYLIHDRDPLFTAEFLEILKSTGVKLPPCSPNLNAYAERFVRTIKGVVPGKNDSVRRRLRAEGHPRICAALPSRAQPPRSGQSAHHPGTACH